MSKEFYEYIEDGLPNFKEAPSSLLIEAFKKEVFTPSTKVLSKNTLHSYNEDLNDFLTFISNENVPLKKVNVFTIKDYQSFLMKKYSPRTVRRKLGMLKRLVNYGYKYQFYSFSLAEWIEYPKTPKFRNSVKPGEQKKEIRELSLEKANIIISALEEVVQTKRKERDVLKTRNRLIGLMLLSTGMRASELINLLWSNVVFQENQYFVEFQGKGGKWRTIPLNEKVVNELFLYREHLGYSSDLAKDNHPIFIAFSRNKYEQLSYDSLYKLIKNVVKYISTNEKISNHISPHWFRHTFVTAMLEQDVPLAVVKELAGHADISTTNLYLERLSNKTLAKEHKKVDFGF